MFLCLDGGGHEGESDEDDPFNNYFHFDDEDFDVSQSSRFQLCLNIIGISQFLFSVILLYCKSTIFVFILQDYLQLGPLELKLLNVTGKKMPIYRPKALTYEEMEASKFSSETFPSGQQLQIKHT